MLPHFILSLHDPPLISNMDMTESSPLVFPFSNTNARKDLKTKVIRKYLRENDLRVLSVLGASHFGFVNNKLRWQCWYKLLRGQLVVEDTSSKLSGKDTTHVDETQCQLDVNRSFGFIEENDVKQQLRAILMGIMVAFFRKYPELRYYQGYHDIVAVFVMVFIYDEETKTLITSRVPKHDEYTESKLFRCVEIFSLMYLRDFMMDSLDFPIDQLSVISYLVRERDEALYKKLNLGKMKPLFAISSILTIYSHDLKPTPLDDTGSLIYEIFDLVISTNSMLIPLTIYSQFIVDNSEDLQRQYKLNIENFDNEVDLVHAIVQKVLLLDSKQSECSEKKRSWELLLDEVRKHSAFNRKTYKVVSKLVNKGSPLLTTASGRPVTKIYDSNDIHELIQKQLQINADRASNPPSDASFIRIISKRLLRKEGSTGAMYGASILVGVAGIILYQLQQGEHSLETTFGILDNLKRLPPVGYLWKIGTGIARSYREG